MKKARLDFDMPKHCDDGCYCLCDDEPWRCLHHDLDDPCGRIITEYDTGNYGEKRPDWCPLIEVKE